MKHWQLFVLMFVLPFIIQMIFMGSIVSTAIRAESEETAVIHAFGTMRWMPLLIIIATAPLFAYQWSVGAGLYSRLPKGVTMNLRLFKVLLAYSFFYMVFLSIMMMYLFNTVLNEAHYTLQTGVKPDVSILIGFLKWLPLFLIMHLFAIFCIFFVFYFNAKLLKSIETGKRARFGDYIGYFFLNWLHFVGVWILQPKINKIHDSTLQVINPEGNTDEHTDILDS